MNPLRQAARSAARLGAAAQNALEVVRFGGLRTTDEPFHHSVAGRDPVHRLRHHHPADGGPVDGPAVLLVPPLMVSTEVYDVTPTTSAVRHLHAAGLDPWVVDFGAPEREEGGLTRSVSDHVIAISRAVDRVREETGRDVHLGGYSQGGMFCYQAAAYRRCEGLASLFTFGSPVDTREVAPFGVPEELLSRLAGLAAVPARRLTLPAWAVKYGFQMLDPVKTARQRLDFLRQLHDRERLLPREGQRRFLGGEGWVAYPGPAIAEMLEQFVQQNRMLSGGFVIDGRMLTLADIDVPTLCFVGEVDSFAPPAAVRGILAAAPRATVYEATMDTGHFGMVVGTTASERTWPTVVDWVRYVTDGGDLPDAIDPMVEHGDDDRAPDLQYGMELLGDAGLSVARTVAGAAGSVVDAVRDVVEAGVEQLPQLVRLQRVQRDTSVSLGRLLARQARETPRRTFFLFGDRAYSWGDADTRVDNVVRGLLSVGVRQGQHVGVLMATRPSALALVSALSRVGAVAVVMRPDGPLEREAELGRISRVIADPEHADLARDRLDVPVLVLGGGGEPREFGFGLTDMERIDPDEVTVPAWYRPNPGRADDLAFVLFTGAGDRTRMSRITNRRWALSAFGTATAARLTDGDTVFSVTPLHHPSGLLTSIGGAIAGGARLALTTSFDPATFWSEARRYGVTVVAYTWTLCRDLAEAPPNPAERGHQVRLFVGSGMPTGLWYRVLDRFSPAGVLEFYASTEGGAVLGNTSGKKVGSKGRPLPGSADVAVAAWDADAERLVEREDGFAIRCAPGEVGMLLVAVDPAPAHEGGGTALRGVFRRGDAWLPTGDLFRVDEDGDHWWVDQATALVHTEQGAVGTVPVEDAVGQVDGVDLVAVYGLRPRSDAAELLVAAVTERAPLDATALSLAAATLPEHHRPRVVHVVEDMPRTTWYRPRKDVLRERGLPDLDARAWGRDAEAAAYVPWSQVAEDLQAG